MKHFYRFGLYAGALWALITAAACGGGGGGIASPTKIGQDAPKPKASSTSASKNPEELHPEGFVYVKDGEFQLGKDKFRFIGANIDLNMIRNRDQMRKIFTQAANRGIRVLRICAFEDRQDNERAMRTGPLKYREKGFRWLDLALVEAGKLDLKVILVLSGFSSQHGGVSSYLKWAGIRSNPDNSDIVKFWTDSNIKRWYRKYAVFLAKRYNRQADQSPQYREDPVIMGWELVAAPENPGDPTGKRVKDWVRKMAATVKGVDPDHLVGIGLSGLDEEIYGLPYRELNKIDGIDFCTMQFYPVDILSSGATQAEDAAADVKSAKSTAETAKTKSSATGTGTSTGTGTGTALSGENEPSLEDATATISEQMRNKAADYMGKWISMASELDKPIVCTGFDVGPDLADFDRAGWYKWSFETFADEKGSGFCFGPWALMAQEKAAVNPDDPDDRIILETILEAASEAARGSYGDRADLAVSSGDIAFSRDRVAAGVAVRIDAKIRNIGTKDATGIGVRFFSGHRQIGGDRLISRIGKGENYIISVDWKAEPYSTPITVEIDPAGSIEELNRQNNRAVRMLPGTIDVLAGFEEDDDERQWMADEAVRTHYIAASNAHAGFNAMVIMLNITRQFPTASIWRRYDVDWSRYLGKRVEIYMYVPPVPLKATRKYVYAQLVIEGMKPGQIVKSGKLRLRGGENVLSIASLRYPKKFRGSGSKTGGTFEVSRVSLRFFSSAPAILPVYVDNLQVIVEAAPSTPRRKISKGQKHGRGLKKNPLSAGRLQ